MSSHALAQGPGEAFPRRFGRYVLFDKIGEGGMANIYLARVGTDLGGGRLVVVKEILPFLASSPEFCRLIIDEAKLSAELSHKNIVQVTDLGREDDKLYIAMEYVEGLDLRELLRLCSKKKIPLPIEFSLYVIIETLRALDYAHRKKDEDGRPLSIVHRDVSPSNVLLSVEGEVKLCDFGIAKATNTEDLLPEEAVQGKAGYMSPEAARGGSVDKRSDLFSAGIMLYELLTGQKLYRSPAGSGLPSVLEQARAANIEPLPSRGYPDEGRIRAMVMKALAFDPADRYESAAAMLRDLEEYASQNQVVANPLRFGKFLMDHFGAEMIEQRRARELAAKSLEPEQRPAGAVDGSFAGAMSSVPPPPQRTSNRPPPSSYPMPGIRSTPPPARGGSITLILVLVAALVGGLLAFFALR